MTDDDGMIAGQRIRVLSVLGSATCIHENLSLWWISPMHLPSIMHDARCSKASAHARTAVDPASKMVIVQDYIRPL
jgi:hypothetical protein